MASAANAADLPLKAPAAATPTPASPWTGFYLGAGLGFRSSQTRETFDAASIGGGPLRPAAVLEPFTATSEPLNGIALRGSSYAGYNWQVAPQWLLGIEGDVGFADQTTTFAGRAFADQAFATFNGRDGISVKTTWDASIRGRVGFLVTPTTLVYATGGAARQHFDISTACVSPFCRSAFDILLPGGPFSIFPALTNNSATKLGWTIGAGVETAIGGHWFARADYHYADYGDTTFTLTRFSTAPFLNPTVNNFDVTLRTHTAAFGLAYKFGDEVAASSTSVFDGMLPVKAFAFKPVAASWSGFYAGLGLGLRASGTDATTTGPTNAPILFSAGNAASEPLTGIAFRGAPYLGWNWQVAPRWVVGIEGDVGFPDQTTSLQGFGFSPGVPPFELAKDDSFAVRAKWDTSARGRLGFLVMPSTLVYATAGAAWQHFDVASTCASSCARAQIAPAVVTNSVTKAGWTAGLGVETILSGNWFLRGEYRYADFGPSALTITRRDNLGDPIATSFDVALRTHTAMLGLAYRFDGLGSPPPVARP